MRILLMRHGEAEFSLPRGRGFVGGALDWAPLTSRGICEVEAAVERLRPAGVTLVASSPMSRALQTAALVSRGLDVPLTVEFDLHEWLPDREFRVAGVEDVCAAEAEMAACGGEWPAGEERGWEPLSSVRRRVWGVLERYGGEGTLLVVTHRTVIEVVGGFRVGTGEVLELGAKSAWKYAGESAGGTRSECLDVEHAGE